MHLPQLQASQTLLWNLALAWLVLVGVVEVVDLVGVAAAVESVALVGTTASVGFRPSQKQPRPLAAAQHPQAPPASEFAVHQYTCSCNSSNSNSRLCKNSSSFGVTQ